MQPLHVFCCIGHRESWEAATVNSAGALPSTGSFLHREEPLGKWSQGNTGAHFHSNLAMGKRAKTSNPCRKQKEANKQKRNKTFIKH